MPIVLFFGGFLGFFFVFLFFLNALTGLFSGNIVVLIVFAYSKRMRTRTNVFLANLAVADFCVGVFCVLPNLSINLSPFWNLGPVGATLFRVGVSLHVCRHCPLLF